MEHKNPSVHQNWPRMVLKSNFLFLWPQRQSTVVKVWALHQLWCVQAEYLVQQKQCESVPGVISVYTANTGHNQAKGSTHTITVFSCLIKITGYPLITGAHRKKAETNKQTHLSGSLKRMVAAQWKTMLMFSARMPWSSLLRLSSGCVRSLLTAMIFSAKSGFSSWSLSKSWRDEETWRSQADGEATGRIGSDIKTSTHLHRSYST